MNPTENLKSFTILHIQTLKLIHLKTTFLDLITFPSKPMVHCRKSYIIKDKFIVLEIYVTGSLSCSSMW